MTVIKSFANPPQKNAIHGGDPIVREVTGVALSKVRTREVRKAIRVAVRLG